MDALCAYTPRCACHVSFTSPNSASTSKYSLTPGHRLLRTQQHCRHRSRNSWCPIASVNSEKRSTAAPDAAESQHTAPTTSRLSAPQHAERSAPLRATVSNSQRLARCTLYGFTAATVLTLTLPEPSYSAEALPIELLRTWVDEVERLGPVRGPLLFIITCAAAEMIPLFPTQPLSLASGLLFGPVQGTICTVCGTTLAAFTAFNISRGVGRRFAERVIDEEMKSETAEQSAVVQNKFQGVQNAIENGSFAQQTIAVAALRLTPVVPFSASNYLLGMTPLSAPAFMLGSLIGMSVWGCVYASIGGASRSLLRSGMDLEQVVNDLTSKASSYTQEAGSVALILGIAALSYYGVSMSKQQRDEEDAQDALSQQESEASSQSPVGRVKQLVQRLKGHA